MSLPVAYARWQLRDFLVGRGPQLLLIGLLVGLQVVLPLRVALGPGWVASRDGAEALAGAVASLEQLLPALLTLLAVNGLVSHDRRTGHYRLLFSKPVSVAGYYAQAFAAHLVGVLLCALALAALFAVTVTPVSPARLLALLAAAYVLMGSVGFLLSTITRLDWIVLSVVWVAAGLARWAWPAAEGWRGALLALLPPVHLLGALRDALAAGAAPDPASLAWLLGYGAAAFGLALAVVRRRPLGA